MLLRVVIAGVILSAVGAWAYWRSRQRPDAPTQPKAHVPAQLDRADFPGVNLPWLVVLFSSESCDRCQEIAPKVAALTSSEVSTVEVEYTRERELHERYAIDGVPLVLIADSDGVVVRHFAGAMSATDLWAAVARLRDPERVPLGCGDHD